MSPVLRQLRLAMAGLVGVLAITIGSPSALLVPALAVRPMPGIGGQTIAETLTPPTTATCRATFHIACYQPFQMQKAYDLAPLFSRGIDGRGRTIVIVDSFGSPTIQDDLKTFDQTFGLPDPPSFQVIQPAGAVPDFPQDPSASATAWAGPVRPRWTWNGRT